jgi:hypothetical protein
MGAERKALHNAGELVPYGMTRYLLVDKSAAGVLKSRGSAVVYGIDDKTVLKQYYAPKTVTGLSSVAAINAWAVIPTSRNIWASSCPPDGSMSSSEDVYFGRSVNNPARRGEIASRFRPTKLLWPKHAAEGFTMYQHGHAPLIN